MKPQKTTSLGGMLIGVLLTGFGLLVLIGAWLKETPLFWRNAGGYPVELREWLLIGFYPALGLYFLLLAGTGLTGWKLLRQNIRDGAVLLLASGLNGILSAVIVTVVLWNNVENLLQNLPLHNHAP